MEWKILNIIGVSEEKAIIAEVRFRYESISISSKRSGSGTNFQIILIYLWKRNPVPILKDMGWAVGPIWTGAENVASSGLAPRTIQPVLSFSTEWAILVHPKITLVDKI
jgi:hypothetical protein